MFICESHAYVSVPCCNKISRSSSCTPVCGSHHQHGCQHACWGVLHSTGITFRYYDTLGIKRKMKHTAAALQELLLGAFTMTTLWENRDLARFSIKSRTVVIHEVPITTACTFALCSKSSRVYRTLDLDSWRKYARSSSKNIACFFSLQRFKASLRECREFWTCCTPNRTCNFAHQSNS